MYERVVLNAEAILISIFKEVESPMRLPVQRPLAPPAQPLVAPRGTITSFSTQRSGAWSSSFSRAVERQDIDEGLRRARLKALASKDTPIIPPNVERRQDHQLFLLLQLTMEQEVYEKEGGRHRLADLVVARHVRYITGNGFPARPCPGGFANAWTACASMR